MDKKRRIFQPVNDIWEVYSESLNEAMERGYIEDDEINSEYVWPSALNFTEEEKEDIQRFIHERMTEIIDKIRSDHGLDPNMVAGYIFRSLICGILIQKERTG